MKVKYDSIWSKIYKFSTGNSNEEMTTDFFNYWFVVIIGTLSLPFTLPSLIVDKWIPEFKWNYLLRLFVGLVFWVLLASASVIYYTFNLTGNLVILWTMAMYMFGGLMLLYLGTVQFPIVGERLIHVIYVLLAHIGFLYSKVKIRPRIEYDKVEVYIIIDRTSMKFIGDINQYSEVTDCNMMHIVVPIKDTDITEYPEDKYLIYTGIKYGNEISKMQLYVNEHKSV